MIDFWIPPFSPPDDILSTPFSDNILETLQKRMAFGDIESTDFCTKGGKAEFIFCKRVGWHRDNLSYRYSALWILQTNGHIVQCGSHKPDPQPVGSVIIFDHEARHRLTNIDLSDRSLWIALFFGYYDIPDRVDVERTIRLMFPNLQGLLKTPEE